MPPIGYEFRDAGLLERALTHASVDGALNNERLEFLGDAVLDIVIAELLYAREPSWSEGRMTRLKADVVSRRSLAGPALRLALGDVARLGQGMKGREPSVAVLANLYEALIGAVHLDGGFEAARAFVRATLAPEIDRALADAAEDNPKQRLQELCQARFASLPRYERLETRGPAHARAFQVVAWIGERRFAPAWGRTVKEAESWAAHEALLELDTAGDGVA